MKRPGILAALSLGLALAAGAAEEGFSRRLRPDEFAAAGLTKLSPEELARLDALVREHRREADSRAARAETEAKAAKAEAAEQKKSEAGRLAQLKQKLTPHAALELEPVESRIKGRFTGWNGRTTFYLENGERWQVANSSSSYYVAPIENPRVRIEPASLGGFWMTVLEVDQRVRVRPLPAR